jgi:peptidyl-prolyl cis-trans isomerase B (cyclophilin B)
VPRAVTIAALALVLVVAGCGGSSSSGSSTEATGGCEDVSAPAARDDGDGTAPTERLDPERTWTLAFDTSCGRFVVTLDLDSAPATAASLVSLAKAGYYDDTIFHRIVPGFVIQGGDPTQSGAGGPGYKTVDVPKADAAYTKGVVAMAKTADEPAGTSGSQFFVVTGRIDRLGDPSTEQPLRPVVIHSVTASSSP